MKKENNPFKSSRRIIDQVDPRTKVIKSKKSYNRAEEEMKDPDEYCKNCHVELEEKEKEFCDSCKADLVDIESELEDDCD